MSDGPPSEPLRPGEHRQDATLFHLTNNSALSGTSYLKALEQKLNENSGTKERHIKKGNVNKSEGGREGGGGSSKWPSRRAYKAQVCARGGPPDPSSPSITVGSNTGEKGRGKKEK